MFLNNKKYIWVKDPGVWILHQSTDAEGKIIGESIDGHRYTVHRGQYQYHHPHCDKAHYEIVNANMKKREMVHIMGEMDLPRVGTLDSIWEVANEIAESCGYIAHWRKWDFLQGEGNRELKIVPAFDNPVCVVYRQRDDNLWEAATARPMPHFRPDYGPKYHIGIDGKEVFDTLWEAITRVMHNVCRHTPNTFSQTFIYDQYGKNEFITFSPYGSHDNFHNGFQFSSGLQDAIHDTNIGKYVEHAKYPARSGKGIVLDIDQELCVVWWLDHGNIRAESNNAVRRI